ncbi:MAG: hypothetical protein ACJASQ_000002 [Crocinitomicaceae bacterium]|jgi:hypothetical protein
MKLSATLKIVTVALLFMTATTAHSQTFLGKRLTVDVGTAVMPNLLTPIFGNDNYFSQWTVFPSTIQAGIGYTPSSRMNLRLELALHKPQIAGIRFHNEYLFDTINQQYIDSFYLSSSNRDLNFCWRIYQDFAPIGRYFTLFGGWSSVQTKIIPSTSYWNVTPNTSFYANDRHETIVVNNNAFRVGMGYGRTQLITRRLYLDFGFRASLTIADKLLSQDEFDAIVTTVNLPDYKDGFALEYDEIHSAKFSNGMRKNLLNTYFFEIYMNFGLSL